MVFLKNNRRFRFLYNGKEITDADYTVTQTEEENQLTSVYAFADGLKVTNIAIRHEGFVVTIPQKRTAKIYFYKTVSPASASDA